MLQNIWGEQKKASILEPKAKKRRLKCSKSKACKLRPLPLSPVLSWCWSSSESWLHLSQSEPWSSQYPAAHYSAPKTQLHTHTHFNWSQLSNTVNKGVLFKMCKTSITLPEYSMTSSGVLPSTSRAMFSMSSLPHFSLAFMNWLKSRLFQMVKPYG